MLCHYAITMAKNNNKKKTTVYIEEHPTVKLHVFKQEYSKLSEYINKLIKQDILRNGDEETIEQYFKKRNGGYDYNK